MDEYSRHGKIEVAGLKAGMGRKAAARYIKAGKLPSDLERPRDWRTRSDPFEDVWPEIKQRLVDAAELEAKTLFEDLLEREPERFAPGQLRTLQRRVKQWRAQEGPDKTVFFAQLHRPGEAAQTDFTWATELGITIGGELFEHMLCHFVLPYSNWEAVTVCHSESMLALKRGIQEAVFQLGRVPTYHQTDHSTAATHNIPTRKEGTEDRASGSDKPRGFNEDYLALMRHLGMTPRTIQVGEKEQNGDVEALNGALKRRMAQQLLLRGSKDFENLAQYEEWLRGVALVHESDLVRRSPVPGISRPDRVGSRTTELGHPVQHVASDPRFGLPRVRVTSPKAAAQDCLVPEEHVLDRALSVVARLLLPLPSPERLHAFDRPIPSS